MASSIGVFIETSDDVAAIARRMSLALSVSGNSEVANERFSWLLVGVEVIATRCEAVDDLGIEFSRFSVVVELLVATDSAVDQVLRMRDSMAHYLAAVLTGYTKKRAIVVWDHQMVVGQYRSGREVGS